MTFTLRPIQPSDNARLAAIIRQGLVEFGANCSGFAWQDPELDSLFEAYQPERTAYYVAVTAGAIAGGAGLAPFACEYPDVCEIQKMYLSPNYRSQGIGKALMRRLLETAKQKGYRGCYLETLNRMTAAVTFYEKLGFKRLDQPLGSSGHSGCNRFYIRWFDSQNQ